MAKQQEHDGGGGGGGVETSKVKAKACRSMVKPSNQQSTFNMYDMFILIIYIYLSLQEIKQTFA